MATRKAIGKKKRFEVFKRDSFTCQYCGKSAPQVVLEIDHIKPVSKGGNNGYLNLVTSCFDCNRGKRDNELSDDTVITKQQKQLAELNEKREQMKMMMKWKDELNKLKDEQVENIYYLACSHMGSDCTGYFKKTAISKLIRIYGYTEVYDCMEISIDTYYDDTRYSAIDVLNKLGGILYNRKHKRGYNG